MAEENRALRKEIGRQERLAISITDQMHTEAQVYSYFKPMTFLELLAQIETLPVRSRNASQSNI